MHSWALYYWEVIRYFFIKSKQYAPILYTVPAIQYQKVIDFMNALVQCLFGSKAQGAAHAIYVHILFACMFWACLYCKKQTVVCTWKPFCCWYLSSVYITGYSLLTVCYCDLSVVPEAELPQLWFSSQGMRSPRCACGRSWTTLNCFIPVVRSWTVSQYHLLASEHLTSLMIGLH